MTWGVRMAFQRVVVELSFNDKEKISKRKPLGGWKGVREMCSRQREWHVQR